jgi:gamma-glutamyltranspeptidase / glutathione hydrolase
MSTRGIIAAGHQRTVQAAEDILRAGGNAFDAVLAAYLAACVAEPVLASLGGGGFMLAKPRDADAVVYDFFVQTPRRKRPTEELGFDPIWADFGTARQEFHIGQGTIATPGCVKGVFEIHRDLGSIPIREIAGPAIRDARQGIVLNRLQAYIFNVVSPIYLASPEVRRVFCNDAASDRVLGEGETLRLVQLAESIERLAIDGPDLFYRGEIGRKIVRQSREQGGHLTQEDLDRYAVIRREPLDLVYRGAHVLINPPPSSGGILIAFALELVQQADLTGWEFGSYPHLRMLCEVMALTAKARVDAASLPTPAGRRHRLLQPEFLDLYRQKVLRRAQSLRGTTQISVIDALGNIASMTVSNGEGCGYLVPDTGIMLNNMLGEQDLNLGGFHRWAENQRMTSMMSPSLIRKPDGTLVATGSGGSNRIRTALLQVIMNLIEFDMDVETAIASPRIHLEAGKLSVEGGFDPDVVQRLILEYPAHEVWEERNLFFGGAHTVAIQDRRFTGAGDPRRGGLCRAVD